MPSRDYRGEFVAVGLVILVSVSPLFEEVARLFGYFVIAVFVTGRARLPKRETLTIVAVTSLMMFGVVQDLAVSDGSAIHSLGTHFYFFMGIFLGWLVSTRIPLSRFLQHITTWSVLFAVLSLLGVALYTFAPELIYGLPTYTYHDTTHHTMVISNFQLSADGTLVPRNAGIASEPGLFQLILNLGLVSLITRTRKEFNAAWLLQISTIILAIILTRSTMGLIILGALLLFASLKSVNIFVGVLAAVIVGGEVIRRELLYQNESKLLGSDSFEIRASPSETILSDAVSNPLGVGNTAYNLAYREMNWGSYDSFTQIIIRYGVPLALLVGILILRRTAQQPLITVVIILTLASQPVSFTPLVAYFYFYTLNPIVATGPPASRRLQVE